MRQRDREAAGSAGTSRSLPPSLRVDDVVEVAAGRVPEPLVERLADAGGAIDRTRGLPIVHFAGPLLHQAQRVVPERVDLDRLAAARRHDPVVDLRVHPGELITRGALAQQTVAGIDVDAEVRAVARGPRRSS